MKPVFLFASFFAACLLSCRPASFFESPNYVRYYPGKLFLTNGRSFEGRLSVEPGRPLAPDIEMYEEGDRHPMRFRLEEVKGYTVRGRYYELRERKGGLVIGRNFSFMTRLTPADSKIQLFSDVNLRKVALNAGRSFMNVWETDLYLQLPGDGPLSVYWVNGTRFSPRFYEKMSDELADCPELAEKIKTKTPGYVLQTDRWRRNENIAVLLRIIGDYNRCR